MTVAKIIQINPAAQRTQPDDVSGHGFVRTIRDDGFKNLNAKPIRGQIKTVQFPADFVHQRGIAQFIAGEIYTDAGNDGS